MEVQASFSLLRTMYHNIQKQKRRMFRKKTKGVYKDVTEAVAGSTFSRLRKSWEAASESTTECNNQSHQAYWHQINVI